MSSASPEHPAGEVPFVPMGPFGFLRRLSDFLRPYGPRCALILLGVLVQVGFYMFLAFFYKMVFDRVIGGHDGQFLNHILGLTGLFLVLLILAELIQGYLSADLGARVISDIRQGIYTHLQRLPIGFYARAQVGDLMTRFTNDLSVIDRAVTISLYKVAFHTIAAFTSVVLLFFMEWRLALITLAALPLSALGPKLFGSRANRAGYELKQEESGLTGLLQENVLAQKVIRAFGLHQAFLDRFQNQQKEWRRKSVRMNLSSSFSEKVSGLGILMVQVLVIGVGAYLSLRGYLSGGSLVGFVGLLASLGNAAKTLTTFIPDLVQAAAGMQHIDGLLNEPCETPRESVSPVPQFSKEIRFENVTFSYTGKEVSLDNVSFTIPAGKSVAFVGRSGSGKSTALNLLTQFYRSEDGAITIDGHDLRKGSEESLRSQIGPVFQDTFLFNATIRENIRQGRLDATDEEVEGAARAAEIHDFIVSLPRGYDAVVSQTGGQLSGGQRQRLALARALLRNPSVLVLDEATSALDPATEAAINVTLERLAKDRTVISVTHRLASVVRMDCIFVLDKGRLVERGTHQELLALKGVYHEMWQKQHGFIISDEGKHAQVEGTRLRAIPLFKDVEEELLGSLAGRFVSEAVPKGETVIREGDLGDKFYITVRGKVEVTTVNAQGTTVRLAVLQDGDYFGEIALLEDVRRTATIRTVEDSLFLTLTRPKFEYLLGELPELRAGFEQVMKERQEARAKATAG